MNETEHILTHIRNCRRVDLYADPKPFTFDETEQWISILKRREIGEPLQYILGVTEFMGLKFKVTPGVLIPRPETELLVEAVLEHLKEKQQPLRVLDMGTGSGNIAVSLSCLAQNISITAVDISDTALDLAKANAKMNTVQEKIKFVKSDLFNNLSTEKFDMMVSNPPYIETGTMTTLDREVLCEPRLALDGGPDGMAFYRRIFQDAPKYLNDGSLLFFEIGADQKENLEKELVNHLSLEILEFRKDLANRNRILILEYTHGKMGH